jgi:phosphopantothenoylcysteine decarboxylase/phosphopantothenate--cysteine ligase
MGYALAKMARRRGAKVTLISGPSCLCDPLDIEALRVETAAEMRDAVMDRISGSSVFIMCAAVADFAPESKAAQKIEKSALNDLKLKCNPDILLETSRLQKRPFTVGFSAETGERLDRAKKKMADKKADMFVFNDVTKKGSGFDTDTNEVTIIDGLGEKILPIMTKDETAAAILDRIVELKGKK